MLFHVEYDSWIWLVLSILAAWRLTIMVCRDAGPFDIMVAIRRLAYHMRLKSLIDCFDCAAIWVSIVAVLLIYRPSWISAILVLAVAGGASIIERIVSGHLPEESTEEEDI